VVHDYQSEIIDECDPLAVRRVRPAHVTTSIDGGKTVTLVALAVATWQPAAGVGCCALPFLGAPR
jgi:hypothetical protein